MPAATVINRVSSFLSSQKKAKNRRASVSSGYPNTEKRVWSSVFLTKFKVFRKPMKHYLECLIYLLNRDKN